MRIIRIDKVRAYLEKGCELSISINHTTDKSVGSLIIMQNGRINGIEEIEVDEFISFFPNIKECLKYRICLLKYDISKGKIVNSIKKQVFSGPYNEESYYQVVDGLEVEADDVFSSFIYQEQKIKNYLENNRQDMKKEKKLWKKTI